MPYFTSFCACCSVRLGSIVVGILSFVQDIAPTFIILSAGPNWFTSYVKFAEENVREYGLDDRYLPEIKSVDKNKDTYFIVCASLHVFYLVSCVLEVIGAFILNKWLLFPFILLELMRLMLIFFVFCTTMVMIKKAINLGVLITISCLGTFALIFLGYLWACVVSLFQIIFIVNSRSYRELYGENPLNSPPKPILSKPKHMKNVERVKFYPSPKFDTDKTKAFMKTADYHREYSNLNQSLRLRNDYVEMRRNYLNQQTFDIGHGQHNSRF